MFKSGNESWRKKSKKQEVQKSSLLQQSQKLGKDHYPELLKQDLAEIKAYD